MIALHLPPTTPPTQAMAAAASTPPATTEAPKPAEPTEPTQSTQAPATEKPADEKAAEEKPAADQVDGAGSPANGNPLTDTELKVEVKLADLQADPDNPLYSAKTFEELQLYALSPARLLAAGSSANSLAGPMSC